MQIGAAQIAVTLVAALVLALADAGWKKALAADPHLRDGLNLARGKVTHPAVAQALGLEYTPPDRLL